MESSDIMAGIGLDRSARPPRRRVSVVMTKHLDLTSRQTRLKADVPSCFLITDLLPFNSRSAEGCGLRPGECGGLSDERLRHAARSNGGAARALVCASICPFPAECDCGLQGDKGS